ncbi:nucleoside monophosphate kinase [Pontiellaceae bacterium B12227]|nr:nucleoside monophosphate kinase [Pontiellaceae bacterium B12227]
MNQADNIIVMGKSGAGKQPRVDVLIRRFGLKQLSTGDIFRTYLGLFNELGDESDLNSFYDSASDNFIPDEAIKNKLNISHWEDADAIVLGLKAKYYVNQGLFVPDHITNALFESAFQALGFRGAVLDGFPRTIDQARFLVEMIEREGIKIDAILLIENEDELIIARTVGRRICRTCGELYHVEHRPPPMPGNCEFESPKCKIIQRSDDTVRSLEARLQEFQTKTRPAIEYLQEQKIPFYSAPGNLPTYAPEAVQASVFEVMQISG